MIKQTRQNLPDKCYAQHSEMEVILETSQSLTPRRRYALWRPAKDLKPFSFGAKSELWKEVSSAPLNHNLQYNHNAAINTLMLNSAISL